MKTLQAKDSDLQNLQVRVDRLSNELEVCRGRHKSSRATQARLRAKWDSMQQCRVGQDQRINLMRDLAILKSRQDAFQEALDKKVDLEKALIDAEIDFAAAESAMANLRISEDSSSDSEDKAASTPDEGEPSSP
ncbi:uncharacterized protein LOC132040976 [Lycium ferocissimum]|uniref:uncharacterized protein LOC132040976 n=1 Tax=Lycium ferocissimum TaxID=112874 RepID=UPI0028168922|nr:uncharacterized protein LOC132040976 [Lycium ferocissimum]